MDDILSETYSGTIDVPGRGKVCLWTNKRAYETVTQAKKARKELEAKYMCYYHMYLCEHCNTRHLSRVDTKAERST